MTTAVVIGLGRVGRNHVEAYQSAAGVELVGVVEVDDERREQLGDALGVPASRRYADAASALATEPDVVSVATPAALHPRHVRAAIDRAEPTVVWCEKPLATSVRAADRLVAHANEHGVELVVNHSRRFSETFERIFELLHEDRLLGTIRTARVATGVELLNLGTHYVDLLVYLLDDRVTRVVSGSVSRTTVDGETRFVGGGTVETSNDRRGELAVTERPTHRLDLIGDEGRLSVPLAVGPDVTPTVEFSRPDTPGREPVATATATEGADDGTTRIETGGDTADEPTGADAGVDRPAGTEVADEARVVQELAATWHREATRTPATYEPGYVPAQPLFENAVGHIELLTDGYDNAAPGTRAVHGLEVLTGFVVASETGTGVDLPVPSALRGTRLSFDEPTPARFDPD